jgi:glycosyltransferase involved in cell wall biosynthesis
MNKKKISICIPAFNEAQNLPVAIKEIKDLFSKNLSQFDYEIIVTDNASQDQTWGVVQKECAQDSRVQGARFSRNFGYQNSIFAGLTLSTGDAVVAMDADLEDPPAIIETFVKHWIEGFDVVYGVRKTRHAPFILRMLFAAFYRLLDKVSDIPIPKNSGDFRLLDRKVVDVLKNLPERNLYLRGLVSFLGFKQKPVYYDRNPRLSGSSKFRLFQYIVLALDALTAFSKAPLRLFSFLGLFLFLASFLLGIYYFVGSLFYGVPVQGFTTLVVLMLFLHSMTFIFLGVIGEYLSRIFDDSKFRPRVIIEETTPALGGKNIRFF